MTESGLNTLTFPSPVFTNHLVHPTDERVSCLVPLLSAATKEHNYYLAINRSPREVENYTQTATRYSSMSKSKSKAVSVIQMSKWQFS